MVQQTLAGHARVVRLVSGALTHGPWAAIPIAACALVEWWNPGETNEQQAQKARDLKSEIRRQQSGEHILATMLVDLVAAELSQADTSPDIDTDWVPDVLDGAQEDLAALIKGLLKRKPFPGVEFVEHEISNWFSTKLTAIFPCQSERIAAALTKRVLGALSLEDSFRDLVDTHVQKQNAEVFLSALENLGRELVTVLGRVERRIASLEEGQETILASVVFIRDRLAEKAGVPSEKELQQFFDAARASCGERMHTESLNRRLWMPHRREPKDGEPPNHLSYLEHTLEVVDVTNEKIPETSGANEEISFDQLITRLCADTSEPIQVLVLAKAGFGKSTFVDYLAREATRRNGLLVPRVVVFREWKTPNDRTYDGLINLLYQRIGGEDDLVFEERRKRFCELVRQGRALLIVDGLDQEGGGPRSFAEDVLPRRPQGLRLVATCREEVAAGARIGRYDLVVRLREPVVDEVAEARLPTDVKKWLQRWVAANERVAFDSSAADLSWAHPFWIHLARWVHHEKGQLPERCGVPDVLDQYLGQVLLAECERAGVADDIDKDNVLNRAKEIISAAAKASLNFVDEQAIQLDHYASGDHYNEAGRQLLTRLLAKALINMQELKNNKHVNH